MMFIGQSLSFFRVADYVYDVGGTCSREKTSHRRARSYYADYYVPLRCLDV